MHNRGASKGMIKMHTIGLVAYGRGGRRDRGVSVCLSVGQAKGLEGVGEGFGGRGCGDTYALQSGQTTPDSSTRKPRPTRLVLHLLQLKHSECQFLSSNVMNLQPPKPRIKGIR